MANELAGSVAVVTGGCSGIGLGTARRFVEEGAHVVIADIDREAGDQVAAELGDHAAFCATDVSDADAVAALVGFAVESFGGLHVMVNNAGIGGKRHPSLLDDDFADFAQVTGVNLFGVMTGTREAARHMSRHGGGSIINVTSIGGIQPAASQWAYHTSKAGIIMFTKSAAIDLGPAGIRVNAIAPGNIETPILEQTMAAHLPEAERAETVRRIREYLLTRQPIQRQGTTDDVAEAALYLATDRSSYVTGTVLPVDGGLLAGSPARPGEIDTMRKPTSDD